MEQAEKAATATVAKVKAALATSTKQVNEFRKLGNNGKEGVNELSMQALTELVDKLNAAELEVEKAATMGIAAESKQMSEEEIVACKKVVEPAYTRKVQLCLRRQRSPP